MNAARSAVPPRPVWVSDWAEVLARADLVDTTRAEYRAALVEYLRFCKQTAQRATGKHFFDQPTRRTEPQRCSSNQRQLLGSGIAETSFLR